MNTILSCLAVILVYRGTVTDGTSREPFAEPVERKMIFSVYDGIESAMPLWRQELKAVKIDKDGTFDAVFGNDELDAFILSGQAKYVGLKIGTADGELRPRRAISSVAAVSRATFAEALATGGRAGTLLADSASAEKINASILEVSGKVTGPSQETTTVAPFALRDLDVTRLVRGEGAVTVFKKGELNVLSVESGKTHRGDVLCYAPSAGFAMIHQLAGSDNRHLVIPAVIQFCRKGDAIRLPTETKDKVRVSFRPFVSK